jgi:amidase
MGAGGSSGGEGCIVSCGAAYFGIGSDIGALVARNDVVLCADGFSIGGSIRIPSAVNGVYGLKPSDRRFAHKGRWIAQGSPEIIPPVNGPIAKSVEDLVLISEIWANESTKYDPESVPMPWKKDVKVPAKLKFGYFIDTDLLRVTPPVRRAMNEAVALLKAAGHEMVEVPMTDGTEFFTLAVQVFAAYNDNLYKMLDETGEALTNGMEVCRIAGRAGTEIKTDSNVFPHLVDL